MLINSYSYATGGGGGGYTMTDSDAAAFITATGITDDTIKQAVDELVLDLKAASIWTKMTAVYPFVGGTSATHAVNLKSPGTFDITWGGTVTHDANGITGNGSTGYGNTGITPSTHTTLHDVHLSVYNRTNAGSNNAWGCASSSAANRLYLTPNSSGTILAYAYATTNGLNGAVANGGRGFILMTRRSSTDFEGYQNGSSIDTETAGAGGSRPTLPLYLCAANTDLGTFSYSANNYAFASCGTSLTDAEVASFNTAVEAFQDFLGRGVV
jgi:hypothetical protein